MILEAFALGVGGDGDLYARDLEAFEMQPGSGHIKGRYAVVEGLHRRIVEHRSFSGVGAVGDIFARLPALVEIGDTSVDAFFMSDLRFGEMIGAAAEKNGVAGPHRGLCPLNSG